MHVFILSGFKLPPVSGMFPQFSLLRVFALVLSFFAVLAVLVVSLAGDVVVFALSVGGHRVLHSIQQFLSNVFLTVIRGQDNPEQARFTEWQRLLRFRLSKLDLMCVNIDFRAVGEAFSTPHEP
jgi:hypothetical protein